MQFYKVLVFAVVACCGLHSAVAVQEAESAWGVNPIRKVVNLLEAMLKKAEKEAKSEKNLFEVAVCTCKKGIADLEKTIAANKGKGPNLESVIKQATGKQTKLKADLVTHRASVAADTTALEEATELRATEKAAFDKIVAEKTTYTTAINKALPALEKGMKGASMLQTENALALTLRNAAAAATYLTEDDRESVFSFLSTGNVADQEYAPAGGEIVGILKNMVEEYNKDLASLNETEAGAVKVYAELKEAKTQQLKSVRYTIQQKVARSGELAVELVQKKGDLKETNAMMAADESMFADLKDECDNNVVNEEKRVKMHGDEVEAIHATVKLLSSGDALDTFKQSGVGETHGSALIQLSSGAAVHKRIQQARDAAAIFQEVEGVRPELRFLELALSGKKVDFSKVTKMIDDMIANDAKAQTTDYETKKHCKSQFHKTEVKKQRIARKVTDQEANKADADSKMQTLVAEIADTTKEVKALDTLVKEAEAERKSQNAEYTNEYSAKTGASDILKVAKERLNKFYKVGELSLAATDKNAAADFDLELKDKNPMPTKDLFKALDDRQPAAFLQLEGNVKRAGDGNKVVQMFIVMINDLKVEMSTMKHDEEQSQAAYERVVGQSAKKRAVYVKSLAMKDNQKADYEEKAVKENQVLKATGEEKAANKVTNTQLHEECDWLIKNFDFRRTARDQEVEGLEKAKAVLSGADYSLVQTHGFLGRH